MSEVKLCKDCKWCVPWNSKKEKWSLAKCTYVLQSVSSPEKNIDLVTGGIRDLKVMDNCVNLRKYPSDYVRSFYICSSTAKWFEQKEIEPVVENKPWWRFW